MEHQTIKQRMPNTLFSCLIQILDAYVAGILQLPLSADGLRAIAMKKWHIFPTKRSLEDMKWFHNGEPTAWFESIAQAYQSGQDEYQSSLKVFIEEFYHEIFLQITEAQIDLATASATQIEVFFEGYEPRSETKNMAYLFLSLCREAGLIPPLENRPRPSSGKFASQGQQTLELDTASETQEGKSMNGLPQGNAHEFTKGQQDAKASRIERQRRYVSELLEVLPEEGQDREWWVDALRSNVELLIKLFS